VKIPSLESGRLQKQASYASLWSIRGEQGRLWEDREETIIEGSVEVLKDSYEKQMRAKASRTRQAEASQHRPPWRSSQSKTNEHAMRLTVATQEFMCKLTPAKLKLKRGFIKP
jgi:hypothetical protein